MYLDIPNWASHSVITFAVSDIQIWSLLYTVHLIRNTSKMCSHTFFSDVIDWLISRVGWGSGSNQPQPGSPSFRIFHIYLFYLHMNCHHMHICKYLNHPCIEKILNLMYFNAFKCLSLKELIFKNIE